SGLLSLVLISAVLAVASRGRTLTIAVLLAIPAVAGRWINHFQPHLVPPAIFLVAGIGLVAFVVMNLLRFVLRAFSVDGELLCASISAYLMLGLIWTMAYWLVDQLDTRSLHVQHDHWDERDDGRFQRFLLQLHHAEHGRLRRYRSGFEGRSHACGNGSDDGTALCRSPDRPIDRPIQLRSLHDSGYKLCDQHRQSPEMF